MRTNQRTDEQVAQHLRSGIAISSQRRRRRDVDAIHHVPIERRRIDVNSADVDHARAGRRVLAQGRRVDGAFEDRCIVVAIAHVDEDGSTGGKTESVTRFESEVEVRAL